MASPKVTPLRGGWKGLLGGIPETTAPSGLGYGPDPATEQDTSGEYQERRLTLMELEAEIIAINGKLNYHVKEQARLIAERAQHQQAIADALAPLGIRAEIAT